MMGSTEDMGTKLSGSSRPSLSSRNFESSLAVFTCRLKQSELDRLHRVVGFGNSTFVGERSSRPSLSSRNFESSLAVFTCRQPFFTDTRTSKQKVVMRRTEQINVGIRSLSSRNFESSLAVFTCRLLRAVGTTVFTLRGFQQPWKRVFKQSERPFSLADFVNIEQSESNRLHSLFAEVPNPH